MERKKHAKLRFFRKCCPKCGKFNKVRDKVITFSSLTSRYWCWNCNRHFENVEVKSV